MQLNPEITMALRHGVDILPRLRAEAHQAYEAAFTAALVYPRAQVYADYLEGELLAQAEEEAEPYVAAVEEARAALAKEQGSIAAKLAAFWERRRADPSDATSEPASETPRVQELRRALGEAEQRAFPYANKMRIIGYQVDALRNTPRPDCVALERLGVGVNEPCPVEEDGPHDAD